MKMTAMTRKTACRMPVRYSDQRQPRDGAWTTAVEAIGPRLIIHVRIKVL